MVLGVTEIECVDDHVNVRTVFPTHFGARNVDHLDPVTVKLPHFGAVLTPIAIRTLVYDTPLFEQTFEDQIDLKFTDLRVPDTESEIFIVHKYRD